MKSTLWAVAFYLVVIAAFVVVQRRQLQSYQSAVQSEMARLIGREVAAAITEPSLGRLMLGDRETREQIGSIIARVTRGSDLVTSISIVDRRGHIVVSDELAIGRQLRRPGRLFGGGAVRFFTLSSDPLRGGLYVMAVPLVARHDTLGYLRIGLDSSSIAAVSRRGLSQFLLVSLLGLMLVVGVAWWFQVRLNRRIGDLVHALEAAGRGETPATPEHERDEFAPILDMAARVGRTLQSARASASAGRRRFGVLAQALDAGLVLFRPDGSLEFANDRALDLFGAKDLAELERGILEIRSDLDPALRLFDPGIAAPRSIDVEIPVGADRRALRLDLYKLLDQEHEAILAVVKDRAAERALETHLRLATYLRSLSRVYVATAHDIRAPLNAVVLNHELLEIKLDGVSDPEILERARTHVRVIGEELRRLRRMLDTLLNQTRISDDASEPFDLVQVVRDLDALLDPYCRKTNIQVRLALPEVPVSIKGSRDAVKQAVLNIVLNAIDAMPSGGELRVSLAAGDHTATLTITDTGVGIAPEMTNRIFSMRATSKATGTGVGLFVARSVVDAHGGRIRVDSEVGRGTRFEVDLPLAARNA